MKKIVVSLLLVSFVYFISIQAFPSQEILNRFDLSKASPSSSFKLGEEFSLKKNYQEEMPSINFSFSGESLVQQFTGQNPEVDKIKLEIIKLKKKRRGSLYGAFGMGVLGGGLLYLFAVGGKGSGQSQERERETATISIARILPLAGAIISWAVTWALVSDTNKKGKAIKAYEQELKKLESQQK
jgi:hypothetical protein